MSNECIFFNGERIFGRIDRIASSYGGSYWRALIAGKRTDYGSRLEDFGSVACADIESVRRELLAIDCTLGFARTGPRGNLRARIKSAMFWMSRVADQGDDAGPFSVALKERNVRGHGAPKLDFGAANLLQNQSLAPIAQTCAIGEGPAQTTTTKPLR